MSGADDEGESVNFDAFLKKPSVDELYEHVRISTNQYKLGVIHNLDIKKLNNIKLLYEDSDFKALKMFELWHNTKACATGKAVIKMLKKEMIRENTVSESYKKALMKIETLIM